MTGGHPAACTCVECTERFLKKKGIGPRYGRTGIGGFLKRIFGRW